MHFHYGLEVKCVLFFRKLVLLPDFCFCFCFAGDVSVEWKTEASSTSTEGSDYHGNLGTIDMENGEWWRKINIDIIDNDVAELTKTFRVFLKNPTGGGMTFCVISLFFFGGHLSKSNIEWRDRKTVDGFYKSTRFRISQKKQNMKNRFEVPVSNYVKFMGPGVRF